MNFIAARTLEGLALATALAEEGADIAKELRAWDALASIPAVRAHRVSALTGDEFVVPGPRVVEATLKLARVIHPDVVR